LSKSRLLSPLRLRLLGLVAVASFPAALLIARLAGDERDSTYLRARESAFRVIDSALAEQQQRLRGGRQLIQALARLPEVTSPDTASCSHALKLLLPGFANYVDVERIRPDFQLDCGTATGLGARSDLGRDTVLARIIRESGSAEGYYSLGRRGEAQATIVEPIREPGGRIRFYIAVDMELSWLGRLPSSLPSYLGATASITRADGLVLARAPDLEHVGGTRPPPNAALADMVAARNGAIEGPGIDGQRKLFVFRQLPSANPVPVLLSIGLPVGIVYREANRNLLRNLLVAAVTLLLALMMAWVAADLLVIRDLRTLLGATDRIASGDLTARVPTRSGGGELHDLAETFNNMAGRLEERRREFLALGDASPDAIVRIDRDLRVEWANDAVLQRLHVGLDAVAGRRITELPVESSAVPLVTQHVRDTLSSGTRREVELHTTANGREGWVDLRFVPERDTSGTVTHVMLIARDVSARKHLETHLAQAERLDSIGKLAGSISHDFNNLLTAIIGNTEIAMRALEPDHRVRGELTEILGVARRASALTRQLLSFARRQPTTPRVIDVKPFIEEAAPLVRRLLSESITLELHLDPGAPRVRFDPTHLEQVLVNLATNARDAMPKGGSLTIASRRFTVTGDGTQGPDAPAPGDYLLLSVTDTGIGMSTVVRERIFEPFFTTKQDRDGTGLGLAVTYGIIRQHNGFIEVDSVEGKGTAFRIFLPATRENANFAPGSPALSTPAPTGREMILLVEDQGSVRTTVARQLRAHGYTVNEARDGVDALRLAISGAIPAPDLLITDLVMPRMGGETLAREMRREFPGVPILLISGFDERGSAGGMIERGEVSAFLEKPFEAAPLLRLVRELLDRAQAKAVV
jgi:PAS domain S-box-containing protein